MSTALATLSAVPATVAIVELRKNRSNGAASHASPKFSHVSRLGHHAGGNW